MAKKKFIIIILSVLLFLSATVLGVSSVYRVDEITVYAPVISKEAEEEAKELKNRLIQTYQKRSTLFADSEDAEKNRGGISVFAYRVFRKILSKPFGFRD